MIDKHEITDMSTLVRSMVLKAEGICRQPEEVADDHTITYGYGYTFLRKNHKDVWSRYEHLDEDLAAIGITLTKNEKNQLDYMADMLNTRLFSLVDELLIPRFIAAWRYVSLTDSEAETLYQLDIERVGATLKRRFTDFLGSVNGTELFNNLQNTREMVALLDLTYNVRTLVGRKLTTALWNGDRAEAWFQIRYKSNKNQSAGLAKRRYMDAQLLGLYWAPSIPTLTEATNAFKMMQRNRYDIVAYEKKYGIPIDGSSPTYENTIALANTDYANVISAAGIWQVSSIEVSLNPAKTALLTDLGTRYQNDTVLFNLLTDANFKSTDIYLNPSKETDAVRASVIAADTSASPRNSLLIGMDQRDILTGGTGDDVLLGEGGDDILAGGGGNDRLYGGAGNDTYFIFDGSGTTRVEDKQGKNVIILADNPLSFFYGVGDGTYRNADGTVSAAFQGTDLVATVIATGGTVILNEDFQEGDFGIGLRVIPTDPVTTATIVGDLQAIGDPPTYDLLGNEITDPTKPQPGKNDRLYDSVADDRIEGGGGNDEIWAERGGNDLLLGGDGDDAINGWAGNDQLEGGSGSDIALGGADSDQVFAANSGEMQDLIAAGEIAAGVAQRGDLLSGNDGDDYLYGADAKDLIYGGAGHDLIVGGGGEDIIVGDSDCTSAMSAWTAVVGSGYAVTITNANIVSTDFAGNDVIYAGTGNDVVYAGAGHDDVDAGEGNDFVSGEDGDDSIYGGGGDDYLGGDSPALAVVLHGSDYIDGGSGNDRIWGEGGADTLFGGSGDDIISGDDAGMVAVGCDDYIDGEDGIDVIVGGTGGDTIFGGAGADELSGDGTDIALVNHGNDYMDGEDGDDAIFGDGGLDTLIGGLGNDQIFGNDGDDEMYGDDGDDRLQGGAGSDAIWGDAGDDTIYGDDGANQLDGGAGDDYIEGGADGDSIWGGDGLDTIFGGDGTNQLIGGAGNDYIEGGGDADNIWGDDGDDTIFGGDGTNQLIGGSGNDYLEGGAGADTILGEGDNDTLYGGQGDDTLSGGLGADRYIFGLGDGQDVIVDWYGGDAAADTVEFGEWIALSDLRLFTNGIDLLIEIAGTTDWLAVTNWFGSTPFRVGQFVFGDGTVLTASQLEALGTQPLIWGMYGDDTLSGTSGNDLICGYDGIDTLNGYAGDDTLDGGSGDDRLAGGPGYDTYVFGWGYGYDTIVADELYAPGAPANVIQLAPGVLPSDVTVTRDWSSLTLTLNGTQDTLYVPGNYGSYYDDSATVQTVRFADGTVWNLADIFRNVSGTGSNDELNAYGYGDHTLDGGAGNDTLYGGEGNDLLICGPGNDVLVGYGGSDTYLFGRGDGQDEIDDTDYWTPGSINTLQFESDILPGDVTFTRDQSDDRFVRINGTLDLITMWRREHLNQIRFGDGTTIGWSEVDFLWEGTESADGLYAPMYEYEGYSYWYDNNSDHMFGYGGNDGIDGAGGDDYLDGGAGMDWVNGGMGDDLIIGGADFDTLHGDWGDDTLDGGSGDGFRDSLEDYDSAWGGYLPGNDTYLFGFGSNRDLVYDYDETSGNVDTVRMAPGVTPADVIVSRNQTNMYLFLDGSWSDELCLWNWWESDAYKVEQVQFEDGTIWDTATLASRVSAVPTEYRDYINGTAGNDDVHALGGDDTVFGLEGDDVLIGGSGYDTLDGGPGNDLLDGGATGRRLDVYDRYWMRAGRSGEMFRSDGGSGSRLAGGVGNDTYVFGAGYGLTTIFDEAGVLDVIQMGPGILPSDVELYRYYPDLTLAITGSSDKLTITGYWLPDGTASIEQIRFDDGTVWDVGAVVAITGDPASDEYYWNRPAVGEFFDLGDGSDGVYAGSGNDTIYGGAGNDDLWGNSGDDLIFGGPGPDNLQGGGGYDTMYGGTGDDTYSAGPEDLVVEYPDEGIDTIVAYSSYTLPSNVENLTVSGYYGGTITGNELNNFLTGGYAADTIIGGDGNDTLDGWDNWDPDLLFGGIGDDTYVIHEINDVVTEYLNEGTDTVRSSIDYSLGANVENLTLIEETATGGIAIVGAGNELDNYLVGNIAANVLSGGMGNDTLDGGAGRDTMTGGTGNDTYLFGLSSGADTIADADPTSGSVDTLRLGAGITPAGVVLVRDVNTLQLSVSGTRDSVTILEYFALTGGGGGLIERIEFADGTVWDYDAVLARVSGPADQSDLIYGTPGNDTLDGGVGSDTMIGGIGDDVYVVGEVGDVVTEFAGEGTDTVQSSIDYTLPANVENLALTGDAAIVGTGNELDNQLVGNGGANVLSGGAGNDTLDGGAGDDAMVGGLGDDVYVVDQPGDVVTESAGEGTDTVQSAIAYALGANVENLTLTGVAAITGTGNELDNQLVGNAGANTLSGGAGNDTMAGGLGDDVYVVDQAGDVVTELAGEGTDAVQSSIDWTLAANVENLTLTGDAAIAGSGNELDNLIVGNAAANALAGGAGNETMVGGAGDDVYVVDQPGDVVTESAGEGTDTVQSSIAYTLGANVENLMLTGGAAISATGNELDNWLVGNAGANTLSGGAGNDTLLGGDGADALSGDPGADVLDGGAGNDSLVGGLGDDRYLFGPSGGVDTIDENDATAGNLDVVAFGIGTSIADLDLVKDGSDLRVNVGIAGDALVLKNWFLGDAHQVERFEFADGTVLDGTGLEALGMTVDGTAGDDNLEASLGPDAVSGFDGNDVLLGGAGNDTLLGGTGADTLNGGAGDDILSGEDGNDSLAGGDGNDALTGGAGDDTLSGDAGSDTLDGGLGADALSGGDGDDTLLGGEDADVLYGNSGADILDGGAGNDALYGDLGNDTYIFGRSSGDDTLTDYDLTSGNLDVLQVDASVLPGDVTLTRDEANLYVEINGSSDLLTIRNYFSSTDPGACVVEQIRFADGTVWDEAMVRATWTEVPGTAASEALTGTAGADFISGGAGMDILSGQAGNDILFGGTDTDVLDGGSGDDIISGGDGIDGLYGGSGADTLDGGAGDDVLAGGLGNDTYLFGRGDGQDAIAEFDTTPGNLDAVQAEVDPLDLIFSKTGFNLAVQIRGTADRLTVEGWNYGSAFQTEIFKAADNRQLLNTQVDQLIQAMATFCASNGYANWDAAVTQNPTGVEQVLAQYWAPPV